MIQFDTEHEGMIVRFPKVVQLLSRTNVSLISMVFVWHHVTAMVSILSFNHIRVGFVQVYNIEHEQVNPATKANFQA